MEEAKERSPNTAADREGEEAGRGKHRKWTGRPGRGEYGLGTLEGAIWMAQWWRGPAASKDRRLERTSGKMGAGPVRREPLLMLGPTRVRPCWQHQLVAPSQKATCQMSGCPFQPRVREKLGTTLMPTNRMIK